MIVSFCLIIKINTAVSASPVGLFLLKWVLKEDIVFEASSIGFNDLAGVIIVYFPYLQQTAWSSESIFGSLIELNL